MMQLTEKYRPLKFSDFAGLTGAKLIMGQLAAAPYESAWLFTGESGTGKTSLGLAFNELIAGELHHIASAECNLATVQKIVERCHYVPWNNGWHVVLVDEADKMSGPAQIAFLTALDSGTRPPRTIFIFTSNATRTLEPRFLSRVRTINFIGQHEPGVKLLARVWELEGGKGFLDAAKMMQLSANNIRTALTRLEMELMMPGAGFEPTPEAAPERPAKLRKSGSRSDAARKAWSTRRQNEGTIQ